MLQWDAEDPDSPALTYDLYFLSEPDAIPLFIEAGLTGKSYVFSTQLAPATATGQFQVDVSDGYNTASALSNPFAIADKPPVVAITAPTTATTIVAGQRTTLLGTAYDFTAGQLDGSALAWSWIAMVHSVLASSS